MAGIDNKPDTQRTLSADAEIVLEGLGVGRGIALGVAVIHDAGALSIPEYVIEPDKIAEERERFLTAVAAVNAQLDKLRQQSESLPAAAAEELGYLLDAYRQMLSGSRLVRGVEARILDHRLNAEAAIQHEIHAIVQGFLAMEDAYLAARAQDIQDVGRRLLRHLIKTPDKPFSHLPKNAIILAEELSPADTALLNPKKVTAFATVLGGAESHTAIVARSLGLPAILGVAELLRDVHPGDAVLVDGLAGRVVVRPSPETLSLYRKKRARFLRDQRDLARLRDVPAVTADGALVNLQANIEFPAECEGALAAGAQGIGLMRSEFLFMNREDVPCEEEQFGVFREIVERMSGKPVTIRTLDAGSDKLAPALGVGLAANPALGLRAIRLSLQRPDLLRAQFAAILRAGAYGPVRILVPMVTNVEEMRQARVILEDVARDLRKAGIQIPDPLPPLGVMIEVPGAALAADALAWHADFFAIGTNDLTQYTLAIDRADEAVAHLYNPLHPAVLRLIQFAAEAALRHRIPLSLCGEMAGDPKFAPLLLGLGIRDLSMSAVNISRVKKTIRTLDLVVATRRARVIMDQSDSARIKQLLDDFNAGL